MISLVKHYWLASGGRYGYRNIYLYLAEAGVKYGRDRALRLMRLAQIFVHAVLLTGRLLSGWLAQIQACARGCTKAGMQSFAPSIYSSSPVNFTKISIAALS